MIDVSVARKSIFCAPISPADNQFRCEIRSLNFSCSFSDARNQYGISPIQCVEQERYIASSESLFRFVFYVTLYRCIVLEKATRGKNVWSRKINVTGNGFLSLEFNNFYISEKRKTLFIIQRKNNYSF